MDEFSNGHDIYGQPRDERLFRSESFIASIATWALACIALAVLGLCLIAAAA